MCSVLAKTTIIMEYGVLEEVLKRASSALAEALCGMPTRMRRHSVRNKTGLFAARPVYAGYAYRRYHDTR
ncbi:unnamed protein product [Toxocara canis]|uniref:Transposase n=1 Tax=Toxocara canis TaxID=6265 RepID=A0A183U2V6_TOXCA|nr:unnamed protein product [Toxocara canis]